MAKSIVSRLAEMSTIESDVESPGQKYLVRGKDHGLVILERVNESTPNRDHRPVNASNEELLYCGPNDPIFDQYKALDVLIDNQRAEQILCPTCVAAGVSIAPLANQELACESCIKSYQLLNWFGNQLRG